MTDRQENTAAEDRFLAALYPQINEHLAEQYAGQYDTDGGLAHFTTWLRGHVGGDDTGEDSRAAHKVRIYDLGRAKDDHQDEQIVTLRPRTYSEARTIGEHFRAGTPVIMNLTEMVDSDAKRLVDFAAGLIFALRGSIDRMTDKVFLLSPAHIERPAEDLADDRAGHRPNRGPSVGKGGVTSTASEDYGESEVRADERFLTVAEIASMMRVSKITVYRLVQSGELEAIRVGRSFRVSRRAVTRYLRAEALADLSIK